MEDIEVGEWVRTKRGEICKVLGISPEVRDETRLYSHKHYYLNNKKGSLTRFYIAKHSFNLIDLIEVGDIVNKSEVYEIGQSEDKHKWVHTLTGFLYYEEDLEKVTILTHEQYDANSYKVE